MNIQDWFPLELTALISLQSKGLSRVFSHTTVQKHQFFISVGQNIGASASASVLPMNIQDWFPLELTALVSLQSKRLARVFCNTTVQKHQFFNTQTSLWSISQIHTWLLEKLLILLQGDLPDTRIEPRSPTFQATFYWLSYQRSQGLGLDTLGSA